MPRGGKRAGCGPKPSGLKIQEIRIRVTAKDYLAKRLNETETYEEYFERREKEISEFYNSK